MTQPLHTFASESSTNLLFDELGKMLHAREIKIVLADAATQGLFALAASQHLRARMALDASLVVHSISSLKTVLGVEVKTGAMDELPASVGVEMARNALDLSEAQLAIALTQSSAKHLELPNCTILGMHWWFRDRQNDMASWMLSQQFVVIAQRDELLPKLVRMAAQETIKVLRLQESPAAQAA